MKHRTATVLSVITLAACGAVVCVGCASRPAQHAADPAPSRPAPASVVQRLVQLSFGREARFALCAGPGCPTVTPKTLTITEPPRAAITSSHPASAPLAASIASATAPEPAPASPAAAIVDAPQAAAGPTPVVAEPPRRRVVVLFPFGSSTLTEAGRSTLRASITMARASDRIVIHGRTDSVGSDEVNQALAFARALAVRDFIRTEIPELPNTIAISARGNCCFVADNGTAEGRTRNRRVEVVFDLKAEVRT